MVNRICVAVIAGKLTTCGADIKVATCANVVGAPATGENVIPSVEDDTTTSLIPVLPKPPGPPAFWFQNENPFNVNVPPRLNVTEPVNVPGLLTHELVGMVAA